jgi:hypothetical protein
MEPPEGRGRSQMEGTHYGLISGCSWSEAGFGGSGSLKPPGSGSAGTQSYGSSAVCGPVVAHSVLNDMMGVSAICESKS